MPVLDASLLISLFFEEDSNFVPATRWAESSLADKQNWRVPTIAIAEVAAGVSQNADFALSLGSILEAIEGLELFSVSPGLARIAARIAETRGIRGCDAIYVALAEDLGDVLVTFDLQQANRAREIIEVVVPA